MHLHGYANILVRTADSEKIHKCSIYKRKENKFSIRFRVDGYLEVSERVSSSVIRTRGFAQSFLVTWLNQTLVFGLNKLNWIAFMEIVWRWRWSYRLLFLTTEGNSQEQSVINEAFALNTINTISRIKHAVSLYKKRVVSVDESLWNYRKIIIRVVNVTP